MFKDLQGVGGTLAACEPLALRAIASWQPSIKPLMDFKVIIQAGLALAGLNFSPSCFFLS